MSLPTPPPADGIVAPLTDSAYSTSRYALERTNRALDDLYEGRNITARAELAQTMGGLGVPAELLGRAIAVAEQAYFRPNLGLPTSAARPVDLDDGQVSYSIPPSVMPPLLRPRVRALSAQGSPPRLTEAQQAALDASLLASLEPAALNIPDINSNPIRTRITAEAVNAINDFTAQRLHAWPGSHVLLRRDRNGQPPQSPAPVVYDEIADVNQDQIEVARRLINTGNVQRQMRPEPIVFDAEALDAAAGGVTREMIAMTTRAIQDNMAAGIISRQTADRFVNRGLLDAVNAGVLPEVAPTDLLTTPPENDQLSRYQQLCELQTSTVASIQRRIGRLPTASEQSELNRVLAKIVFEIPDKPLCVPAVHERIIDI